MATDPQPQNTEVALDTLASELSCRHVLVYSPTLFFERIQPQPRGDSAVARSLIHDFLWPLAQAGIEQPLLNRVRLGRKSQLLPYRLMIAPLSPSNPSVGFIAGLRAQDEKPFTETDLAGLAAGAARLMSSMADRVDKPTGLLLRAEFETEVALRIQEASCVLYANLDQIHAVNEHEGFAAGDRVIRGVGQYLYSLALETGNIATHLSGDRFAAVLLARTLNQARTWAEKAREGVESLMEIQAGTYSTVSIGIAVLNPGESFQHALAAAETACRVAKDRGRNRVELYMSADETVMRRHRQVQEYRHVIEALDSDSFQLVAQPIVPLADQNARQHHEILLRVAVADGELQSIAGYLEAAERYQLLERIDRWVVSRVLDMLLPKLPQLTSIGASFALNVTGQSISQPEFADYVCGKLKASGIPSHMIDFEMTETSAIRNVAATRRFIARMKSIGAQIALDDFGTGASSLIHLKDLNVDRIKIDGQFVADVLHNPRSAALIRALAQIAKELGLDTVAEFVASPEVATALRNLGIQRGQGHFFAKPRLLSDVLEELAPATAAALSL
jgi:diguanylate cyclase (GGDEF)-like protein